jgi:hypothetical protein
MVVEIVESINLIWCMHVSSIDIPELLRLRILGHVLLSPEFTFLDSHIPTLGREYRDDCATGLRGVNYFSSIQKILIHRR